VSSKLVDFRLDPADFGKDCVGIGGPSGGFTVSILVVDVVLDRGDELFD
jgi:hypothetical protein